MNDGYTKRRRTKSDHLNNQTCGIQYQSTQKGAKIPISLNKLKKKKSAPENIIVVVHLGIFSLLNLPPITSSFLLKLHCIKSLSASKNECFSGFSDDKFHWMTVQNLHWCWSFQLQNNNISVVVLIRSNKTRKQKINHLDIHLYHGRFWFLFASYEKIEN